MNIEKAIDFLEPYAESSAFIEEEKTYFNMAIFALRQQINNGWIPVSERRPEVNDGEWATFIIPSYFNKNSTKIIARYFKEQGINCENGWTDKRVITATHWMPLPELYKEETK